MHNIKNLYPINALNWSGFFNVGKVPMNFSVNFNLIAVATMWLLHTFFGTFILAHYYQPWVIPTQGKNPNLFWPEPDQIYRIERPTWMWPPSAQRWLRPAAAGPADYEPELTNGNSFPPNREPPNRFDQTTPQPSTINEVTPERFGFVVQTSGTWPSSKGSSSPAEGQFIWGSSPSTTKTDSFQKDSSVSVSESGSTTTTEAWTFPPSTQSALEAKIQLSMCINKCVTDKSIKSVCGSDNKTYQNRQYLDCAQQCGQNIRLDYTGRCIPNPQ